jgi:peptidyl-prolyl cis-trans isomerase SurA
MKIKSLFYIVILICLFTGNPLYAEMVDRIVSIVNGDIITQYQLNKETGQYRKRIALSGESEIKKKQMIKEVNQKALEALIDQTLTRQEAQKYNINIIDADVDETIEKIIKDKKINPESFKALIRQEGMGYDEYRANIRNQLLQVRVINAAVQSKVVITDADIQKAYEKNKKNFSIQTHVHLKNILIGDRKKIEKIKKRLDNKANFAVLAKLYSSAPNAKEGGELGIFNIRNFSEKVQKGIASLKKGDHTDIIATPEGYQIFYVADIIKKGAQTFEQARDEIYEKLYRERIEQKFKIWLESLKKNAYIKIVL